MKAAYIDKFGGPEVLKVGDLPDPSPGPGQVVVDTVAASINAADWKVPRRRIQAGQLPAGPRPRFLRRGQRARRRAST
jgi:NADPH:quinone reductase-like Zn-dependent oxidoreductase